MTTYGIYFFSFNSFTQTSGSSPNAIANPNSESIRYDRENFNYTFHTTPAPSYITVYDTPDTDNMFDGSDSQQTVANPGTSGMAAGSGFSIANTIYVTLSAPGQPTIKTMMYRTDNGNTLTVNGIVMPQAMYDYLIANPNANIHITGMDVDNRGSIKYSDLAVCFAADAMIETQNGPVPAAMLKAGDMVRTQDAGYQPIRWIGARHYKRDQLTLANRPIRIKAGALGDGLPEADLVVSPQHRILVRSRIAQKMFGTDEVLVAAKQLLRVDGIDVASDLDGVTYVHFMFDTHQIVFANGAEAESLFTGPEALKAVGPAARDEIFSIFPELLETADLPAARLITSGKMGRKLAERHMQNQKPLLM